MWSAKRLRFNGARAFKLATNHGKQENFHPIFQFEDIDPRMFFDFLPAMRAKFQQEVQLHFHLFEPSFSGPRAIRQFLGVLTKSGHKVRTLLHADAEQMRLWTEALSDLTPKQNFVSGDTLQAVMPDWAQRVSGVSAIVQSADASRQGTKSGISVEAQKICDGGMNAFARTEFLTKLCPSLNSKPIELTLIFPL